MSDRDMLLVLGLLCVTILATSWRIARGYRSTYPPGPKPWFFIGNIFDIPAYKPWNTFTDWRSTYGQCYLYLERHQLTPFSLGDLIHFELFGQHTVIVNTRDGLLNKRSAVYSSRPYLAMMDLTGTDRSFNSAMFRECSSVSAAFLPYGEEWRAHRRLYHRGLRYEPSLEFLPTQARKVREFLVSILNQPEDFVAHTRTLGAAVIMAIVYGHDIAPKNDRFVMLAEKAVAITAETASPLWFAVNFFPFLLYLPGWFPGCGFQQRAEESRLLAVEMMDVPFGSVKRDMALRVAKPSLVVKFLKDHNAQGGDALQEAYIKRVAATAYAAGAETTSTILECFFLAMILHPSVQEKAQQEMERILGKNRLPTFEDRASLPYIEAVYREALRWSPILPLGIPHCTSADDVVGDYFIPKGITVMANVWAIARDPHTYPEPSSFVPERFLKEDGTLNEDDVAFAFGFGRRLCPGRHVGNATTWLAIASLLTLFDIRALKDAEINPDPDKLFAGGILQ
uniref:Cytochrome P450 n=1 Tax=Moniliophthora roreri TaxID=221103 RepID=A0A0W0F0M9_MONRR